MVNIPKLIDHSLLKPDATVADILRLCDEARRYGFFAVCVHPYYTGIAKEALFKTHVKIATVIGFPHGMTFTGVKIYEAIQAVLNGADELDIVINTGLAKSGDWGAVQKEISDIVTATPEALHKIIIETYYLTDDEKKKACEAAITAGAEYIKTSTGFAPSGADIRDVILIKSLTKGKVGIKAAGGIKTLAQAKAFIDAGATRIGTSSGVSIMKEAQGEL
ncbi:MAG: deoxyribose-phosphate aldolase [Nitrospirae bacterium]|nr:deoxyribose-phosphate aldolase [Nitrospirota bacterium]